MKCLRLAVLFAAMLMVMPYKAFAVVLAEIPFSANVNSNSIGNQLSIFLRYNAGSNPALFESIMLTTADIGSTFTATSATDSDFNDFIALLTNGVNETLFRFEFFPHNNGSSTSGIGNTETQLFSNNPFSFNAIDFASHHIQSIQLQVLALNFPTDGGYSQQSKFIINSQIIPEPTTLILLMAGLLPYLLRRKQASA